MAWSLSLMLGKILPNHCMKVYKAHVVPALLLIVCSVSVWIPGLRPGLPDGKVELAAGTGISGDEIGWRIALGVILAVGAYAFPVISMWLIEKYLPEGVVKKLRKILI